METNTRFYFWKKLHQNYYVIKYLVNLFVGELVFVIIEICGIEKSREIYTKRFLAPGSNYSQAKNGKKVKKGQRKRKRRVEFPALYSGNSLGHDIVGVRRLRAIPDLSG